ncbi:MAG: cytoplasmic protein [Desulfatibacillaceae bacterium]
MSDKKVALFGFNGEQMCFVHVLLNALDYHEKGWEAAIIVEGSATKLLPDLATEGNPFHKLYAKARDAGLFAGACRACSAKMGVLDEVRDLGFALLDDMSGHPSISGFQERGYTVITF